MLIDAQRVILNPPSPDLFLLSENVVYASSYLHATEKIWRYFYGGDDTPCFPPLLAFGTLPDNKRDTDSFSIVMKCMSKILKELKYEQPDPILNLHSFQDSRTYGSTSIEAALEIPSQQFSWTR